MSASIDSRWLVAALAQKVQDFVICAGSRSAPLTYAVADAEASGLVRAHPFFDERSAAFFALGLAQSTGRPVAIVTTSGTAPAHILPAVIEAWHTGAPLIVVSADRPFEMHEVGASQTTTQSRLFDGHVVSFLNIPAGLGIASSSRSISEDAAAKSLINRVRRLLASSVGLRGKPGPAHINVQLRDPLVPAEGDPSVADLDVGCADVIQSQIVEPTPWEHVVKPLRTVVLAGDKAGVEASQLAVAAGVPLLAEPSSGSFGMPGWVPHEQQMIALFGDEIEQVVVLGHPSLSRPVSRLLAREDVRVVVVSDGREYTDVSGNADVVVAGLAPAGGAAGIGGERADDAGSQAGTAEDLGLARGAGTGAQPGNIGRTPAELRAWSELWSQRAEQISTYIDTQVLPDGVRVARAVWDAYAKHPDHALILGASNPIRYVDLAATEPMHIDGPGAVARAEAGQTEVGRLGSEKSGSENATASPASASPACPVPPVHAARGQAGIDGTIATGRGFSCGLKKPARILVGDLTFLHDLNSLAVRKGEQVPPVDVVLIDDGGGRIFKSLEHGLAPEDLYERFFAIGQSVDYCALAQAFGWQYVAVDFAGKQAEECAREANLQAQNAPTRGSGRPDAQRVLEEVLAQAPSGRLIHVLADHSKIRDELRNLFPENIQ